MLLLITWWKGISVKFVIYLLSHFVVVKVAYFMRIKYF